MIGIIDYAMGNIHSVQKALEAMGADTIVTNKPEDFKSCDKLVLPGVGAFDDAVIELEKRGLVAAIKEFIDTKKAFLGICLGMQLFLEKSEEAGSKTGLGIIKGEVKKFSSSGGIKVPHMGWNTLSLVKKDCPLFKGISDKPYVYFCHSYYPDPSDKGLVAATSDYGINFASIIWKDNLFGVQFHPEKSQGVGLAMLKNFVSL